MSAPEKTEMYAPVFVKDGNEFIIPNYNFVAEDEDTAREIGLGAMLVECPLLGMTSARRVLAFEPERMPHVAGEIGPLPVAIIAGPAFDAAFAEGDARAAAPSSGSQP